MKILQQTDLNRWIMTSGAALALLCVPTLAFSQRAFGPFPKAAPTVEKPRSSSDLANRTERVPESFHQTNPVAAKGASKPHFPGVVAAPAGATARLQNISTRMQVLTGDNVLIGGFIVTGTQPKTVVVRGMGPSLPLSGALSDPVIELHSSSGELLAGNDDWMNSPTRQQVIDSGLAPTNNLESALWAVIDPGAYTVIVRGYNNATGVGLFEVYDLDQAGDSNLGNVSTRGFVNTGDHVMIGGIIIGPPGATSSEIMVRAIGPSLAGYGIQNALADPTLEVYNGNGTVIGSNDNWQETQEAAVEATGIEPVNDLESAFVATLAPGAYTAIVRGKNNGTGVALVEVYKLLPQILETVTQSISGSQGGTITLPSGNSVALPAGTFASNNDVALSLLLLGPSTMTGYENTTGTETGPPAGQIVSVKTGLVAPDAEISVSLKVPVGFPGAGFTPRLFVKSFWEESGETLDGFEPLNSVYNPNTHTVTATVPLTGFTSLRNAEGKFECLILVGSVATPAFNIVPRDQGNCSLQLFAPIAGLSRDQLTVTRAFGYRIHPITHKPQGHKGVDIVTNVTDVVPAADGEIVRIGYDQQVVNGKRLGYGQYVLVQHSDGSQTRYAHLVPGSIDLANQLYPDYPKTPGRPPLDLPQHIPLTGGTSRIGTMDTSGGATARHLHFEFIEPGTGPRDPFPCITLPPPTVDPWNGSWVGTYTASHGGTCNWTDAGNITLVFNVSGNNISGSISVDGIEVRYFSDCTIAGYDTGSGSVTGTKLDDTASLSYTGTESGLDPGPLDGSMTATRSGTSITGTITILGGTGPMTLTKQ